jgi:hypothetical protein
VLWLFSVVANGVVRQPSNHSRFVPFLRLPILKSQQSTCGPVCERLDPVLHKKQHVSSPSLECLGFKAECSLLHAGRRWQIRDSTPSCTIMGWKGGRLEVLVWECIIVCQTWTTSFQPSKTLSVISFRRLDPARVPNVISVSINSVVRRLPQDDQFSVKMEMSKRLCLSLVCQRLKDGSLSLILCMLVSSRKNNFFNIGVGPSRACNCFMALFITRLLSSCVDYGRTSYRNRAHPIEPGVF